MQQCPQQQRPDGYRVARNVVTQVVTHRLEDEVQERALGGRHVGTHGADLLAHLFDGGMVLYRGRKVRSIVAHCRSSFRHEVHSISSTVRHSPSASAFSSLLPSGPPLNTAAGRAAVLAALQGVA